MTRKRPVAMLIFGILNLIFGTISLAGSSCCGFLVGGTYFAAQEAEKKILEDKKGQKQLNEEEKAQLELGNEAMTVISTHVPGAVAFMIASFAGGIVLAFLQVLSGIGLVMIHSWGRWLCVFWAMLGLIGAAAWLVFWFTAVTPNVTAGADDFERLVKKIEEQQQKMKKAPVPRQNLKDAVAESVAGLTILNLAFLGLYSAYAGLALLFMILPGTGLGIARYRGAPDIYPQSGSAELYDDDYMRRRRDSGQSPPGM